jgi:RNA polymerase sigma factor (sigma-70 family)
MRLLGGADSWFLQVGIVVADMRYFARRAPYGCISLTRASSTRNDLTCNDLTCNGRGDHATADGLRYELDVVEHVDLLGQRLRDGEESALEDCYSAFGPMVLAYLRRNVGPDSAEDVLQRTFLDVWRGSSRYDPAQSLAGWVFTIARRRAVDELRTRRAAVVPVEVLRNVIGDDGRRTAERYAWAAELRQALGRLPAVQRQALELAYFEDRTQRDIAQLLDVPIGTVKARMARGTRALADLLRETQDDGRTNVRTVEGGDVE